MRLESEKIDYKIMYSILLLYPLIDIFYVINEIYFKIEFPINQIIRGGILLFIIKQFIKTKDIFKVVVVATILGINELFYLFLFKESNSLISNLGYVLKILLFIATFYAVRNMLKNKNIKMEELLKLISFSSIIISCNILLAKYFGLGFTSYIGDFARNGFKGYFLTINMVVSFMTIITPIVFATYIQSKERKFFYLYLVDIYALICTGSKFGILSSLFMIVLMGIYFISKIDIKKYFKKLLLVSGISLIILGLFLGKDILNFIDALIQDYEKVNYQNIFAYLVNNRNLQILYLNEFIDKLGWAVSPLMLFGLGFSNANKIVEIGKSDFKIIEMDFHGLLYYSGIIVTTIIIVFIAIRLFKLVVYVIKNKRDFMLWSILISILLVLVQSILGGHVIYEAGPAFYFSIVLAISEYIVNNRYSIIEDKYTDTSKNKIIDEAKIGIVLVNYNGEKFNDDCLESIFNSDYKNYEIIIVDNNSLDNSVDILKQKYSNKIKLIELKENLGFSVANNVGIELAIKNNCDYILLLNNDTIINKDMITTMVNASDDKKYVVSPKIYYYSNKDIIWSAGGKIDWNKGMTIQYGMGEEDSCAVNKKYEIDFATGCCMLIPTTVIKTIGLLSDEYFLYYEDTDYCVRIRRAGFKIIYEPKAVMYHRVSASTGGTKSPLYIYYMTRNRLIFNKKFNKRNIIAMSYFYTTTIIKAIINKIKKQDYIVEETKRGILDYKDSVSGKSDRF